MRLISKIILAIITGTAALWITVPDVVTGLVHGLPRNALKLKIAADTQEFHFHHSATGVAWLIWIALLLVGWYTKRWGKKQLQVGAVVGLVGALPLLPFLNMGGKSIRLISRHWDWLDLLLLILVALILLAKAIIWRYWWLLTTGKPLMRTGN